MTLPVQDLIVQQLLEFDPDFDVGGGISTTGLMIEPLSVILQPIINELSGVQTNQSILSILETADPDAYPEDIVDGLASNVYIERILGEVATTTQRIRFFEPQDFSSAQGILVFRGPGGQRYTNAEAVSITEAEMSLNIDGGLVYVDIPIVSVDTGDAFNVDAGAITTMEAEPAGVANTTNLFDVLDGRDRETNTELIDRIKIAVTVRALVTGRGIIVTLTENFTTIVEVQPVGFGDPEMMRDIVYNTHIGGNVDVYIKTSTLENGEDDILDMEVDATRQVGATTVLTLFDESVAYDLERRAIDRTNTAPVVTTIDGLKTYVETTDYTIDDTLGTITRVPASNIFHITGAAGNATDNKTLFDTGAFASVRAGMKLTVTFPAAMAGVYTVRSQVSSDEITIYGTFPDPGGFPTGTVVDYAIDDSLNVAFEHNPISIDIIQAARSVARDPFTIINVPYMKTTQVAVLDPISGDPTGELLSGDAGFGVGGFGEGGFGAGDGGDYRLVVTEPTLRFSVEEDNFLEFDLQFLGYSVRVNYIYAAAIAAIQAFMDDSQNRTLAADLLARHFTPAFVSSTSSIKYTIDAADEPTAITVSDMTTVIEDFIKGIAGGDALETSDLVDLFYDNGAKKVDIDTLSALQGTVHHHNGTTEFLFVDATGAMEIPNETIPDPSDKPLSPRIARFIPDEITLERTVA